MPTLMHDCNMASGWALPTHAAAVFGGPRFCTVSSLAAEILGASFAPALTAERCLSALCLTCCFVRYGPPALNPTVYPTSMSMSCLLPAEWTMPHQRDVHMSMVIRQLQSPSSTGYRRRKQLAWSLSA